VKLSCPLELLPQYEEMAVTQLPCPLELEMMEVAIAKPPCHLEMTNVAVAELLTQYEEMTVAELFVDQKKWQVHGPWVMMLVFDLTVYAASVVTSAYLRKFRVGSII
jgi:hypothetical protein